jgi:hypothetical protein
MKLIIKEENMNNNHRKKMMDKMDSLFIGILSVGVIYLMVFHWFIKF